MTDPAASQSWWSGDDTLDTFGAAGPGGAFAADDWAVAWEDTDDTWEIDLAEPWPGVGVDADEPPPGDDGEPAAADQPWAM